MTGNSFVFEDFHIHGASAPEWNQRYLQMSPGVMHSSLSEWSGEGVHLFRKWMSERVVQQGALPRNQFCIALLDGMPADGMRVQGHEFSDADFLVLRGGEPFEFQRPAGVQLLSVTFPAEDFLRYLEDAAMPVALRNASTEIILRPLPAVLEALRRRIRSRLATGGASDREELMRSVSEALAGTPMTAAQRRASMAAARMVKTCHEIVLAGHPDHPLRIEELCLRLHTSRRTLQGSFNRVTATSPVVYVRNLRLNVARQRLMASAAKELNVSQAAAEAGFDHLGHFAGEYKALFGEVPSQTPRATRTTPASRPYAVAASMRKNWSASFSMS